MKYFIIKNEDGKNIAVISLVSSEENDIKEAIHTKALQAINEEYDCDAELSDIFIKSEYVIEGIFKIKYEGYDETITFEETWLY